MPFFDARSLDAAHVALLSELCRSVRLPFSGKQTQDAQPHLRARRPYLSVSSFRTLDAPDIVDDYYLSLLDWGRSNKLAVALADAVYLWDAATGDTDELFVAPCDVTSVRWAKDSDSLLAVGTGDTVQLLDVEARSLVRTMGGHGDRVGRLAWRSPDSLASGSRDASVFVHDVRARLHRVTTLLYHTKEVCDLEWSPNGRLLASGGNDNAVAVWEPGASTVKPVHALVEHTAAVRALAWCPWQPNVLASGGGSIDRCIKFWNTDSGARLGSVDTHSQVTSLLWSPPEYCELVSTHGYTDNQLSVWSYPSMAKVGDLTGHGNRVLHATRSPDGAVVASASADETLRLWNVWPTVHERRERPEPSGFIRL